jgi:hypothetical protein
MDLQVINTTLGSIAKSINWIKDITGLYTTKSLSEVTKLTRVEPLTILSRDCLSLEYIGDVNQTLLSMFSAYYLQAVGMLTKVNDVEVVRILDKLNPDRDETGFLLSERYATEETVNLIPEAYKYSLPGTRRICKEDDEFKYRDANGVEHKYQEAKHDINKEIATINELSNLSVGKLLNVDITYSKKIGDDISQPMSVKIPVNVRLMVSSVTDSTISHLLSIHKDDQSVSERYHAWRSGRISFIKDLIFCQDLIDEHRRAVMSDESGTIDEIMRRVNNAKKFGLLTHNPSLVSASNLFVITENVARELEDKLGGKLANPKVRKKAFENTYAMIICVIDREWERVTFYIRDITSYTELSVKEIKNASKGSGSKGPDIGDILKSLQMGAAPQF